MVLEMSTKHVDLEGSKMAYIVTAETAKEGIQIFLTSLPPKRKWALRPDRACKFKTIKEAEKAIRDVPGGFIKNARVER
jgi:hypothetical protein